MAKPTVVWARSGLSWAHLPGATIRRACPVALPGEGHHNAKLTAAAVMALRDGKLSAKALIEASGVGPEAVRRARKGVTWKHLPLTEAPQLS